MTQRVAARETIDDPSSSLSHQAYERLVDMMLTGDLPAGTILQERRLAEALDISRTPVREALTRMNVEGLVNRVHGRTVIVRSIYEQEMMEILQVRGILEAEAVTMAATAITDAEIETLRADVGALLERDEPAVEEHWHVDDRLHGLIAERSGNRTMAGIIRDLRRKTRIFNTERLPERFRPGCREHLAILDALKERDVPRARAAVEHHIDNAKQGIIDKLNRFGR